MNEPSVVWFVSKSSFPSSVGTDTEKKKRKDNKKK